MKSLKKFALLAITLVCTLAANAQTAEEIVASHIKALGGTENWAKVKNIIYQGSMAINGAEIAMTMTTENKVGMKIEMEIMGMKGYQLFTPTEGWMYMPFAGQKKPEAMPAEMVKASKDQLLVGSSFLTYKEEGKKLEYLGKEDIDGTECHKLKLSGKTPEEPVVTYFIDPTTFYLLKEIQLIKADGKEMENPMTYSNFQTIEPGVVVAYTMGSQQGEIEMKTVKVNQEIPADFFKPAAQK